MKIIITERQLFEVVLGNRRERYLNYLLDKFSEHGMDSLTPEEKDDLRRLSKGEEVDKPIPGEDYDPNQPESEDNGDVDIKDQPKKQPTDLNVNVELRDMFFTLYPYEYNFEEEKRSWTAHVWWEEDKMVVTDQIATFYVYPFVDGNTFVAETSNGIRYSSRLAKLPENEEQMQKFIFDFNKGFLPMMVKKIKGKG